IQPDNKIVVGGATSDGAEYNFALTRYNSDGTLDNSFDTDGTATTGNAEGGKLFGVSIVCQPDGKIIEAGKSYNEVDHDFALVRYNNDGSIDTTFGTDGFVNTDIDGTDDHGSSVRLQPDNKIVLAGYSWNGSDYNFALVRYNIDGTLDNTFGLGGKVTTDFANKNDYAYSLALQPDGKFVVAGSSIQDISYVNNFALCRYNIDGTLDETFGIDGKVATEIGGINSVGFSVAIQNDSKIVLAGHSRNALDWDFAVARYWGDGHEMIVEDPSRKITAISPNPANEMIYIDLDGIEEKTNVQIFSVDQKLIMSMPGSENEFLKVNISDLPSGIYLINIMGNTTAVTKKFVKQ
ncbi:MAG: T9SS type A sorting domain-containing protein, partial [Chitinophagales bacterium]